MAVDTRNKRKLIVASVAGVGIFLALVWYASPATIWATVKGANFQLIGAAWAVSLFTTVIRTARFSMFVPIGDKLLRAYAVFSLSRFINMSMPFRTGDIAMLAVLKKAQMTRTIAHLLPVWFVLRISDALALAVWFCGAVIFSTLGREYLPLGVALIIVAVCALFFMQHAVAFIPDRLLRNTDNWLIGRLSAVIEGVRESEGVAKRILASLGGLMIWGSLIGSAVLTQMAFGTPLGIEAAFLAAVFAASFSVIPVNAPLAVGTGEIMWAGAMVLVGLPLEVAIPLAISVRLSALAVMLIEATFGGVLLIGLASRAGADMNDTEELLSEGKQGAAYEYTK